MYAEEVYSRMKVNADVAVNLHEPEHDKYSKSKSERKSKRSKVKRPLCSETSIILFMLVFFACSCFVLMVFAPDVIDTVSIKLEEYTIIIDAYLPMGDENSSLIFQTITREDERVKVGNVKSKDELDKEAEEEAYRLLQQADDERMQIAHAAMEKVNAKILLAIQQRERKIKQQRKEDARVGRTKLFDETIAKERQRLHESQSKMGRKRRPNSIFINGQEVVLPEERPTPNSLRKDPHIHVEKKKRNQDNDRSNTNHHLIEEKPLGDKPLPVKLLIDKQVFKAAPDKKEIIEVPRKRGSAIEKNNDNKDNKIDRDSNGKLKVSLSDEPAVRGQEVKVGIPNAENIKLDSEQLVEIDNGMHMIGIASDQKGVEKKLVVNDLTRVQPKDLNLEDFDGQDTNNAVEKQKDFLLGIVEMNNPDQNIKIENNDPNTNSNPVNNADIPVEVERKALSDVTNNKKEQQLSGDRQHLDIPGKAAIPPKESDIIFLQDKNPAKRISENKVNKDSAIVKVPDLSESNANVDRHLEDKVSAEDNVDKNLVKGQDPIEREIVIPFEPEAQADNVMGILSDLKDLNEAEIIK